MPYTPNRWFKAQPRILTAAQGMYYTSEDGRQILDAAAGMWCVNAGHAQPRITRAIQDAAAQLDYATCYQAGHPKAFEAAQTLCGMMPGVFNHVFFSNSGSEAVDTALKIALNYHYLRGEGQRTRLIGRQRAYHGVGFGGISVGGLYYNRKKFGPLLPGVDHLPHTHELEHTAFSKGQPEWGAHKADALEEILALHGPETVAAVIVEPIAGSTGVFPPPRDYLERLRAITAKHGIFLIFDEVVTGFGRMGKASYAEYSGIIPDMICTAKGMTNAAVPMGGTFVQDYIYELFMDRGGPETEMEFFHGYTYSGHPLAAAAAIATAETYRDEGIFENATRMAPLWEEALHRLRDAPHVIDIRNMGILGGIELAPRDDRDPSARARECYLECYHNQNVLPRYVGNSVVFSPPLILQEEHIEKIVLAVEASLSKIH